VVTSVDEAAGGKRASAWTPALTGDLAAAARDAALDVASRLQSPDRIEAAAAAARNDTFFPRSTAWVAHTISQGYAGLALLYGYLDNCFADQGWDVVGREHLERAARDAEAAGKLPIGLFSGLSGLAFAAWQLSRDGTRYRRLLATLDSVISDQALELARYVREQRHGVTVGDYDVISGLSGVGAYLLCRRDQPGPASALSSVTSSLVQLVTADNVVPRWHTPARLLWDEGMVAAYPFGNLNCGLAHGIPGPLALLAAAVRAKSAPPDAPDAIARIGDWLAQNRYDDEWGVNWPTAVPLEEERALEDGALRVGAATTAPDGPSRCAWCYGSPGIARALWLAGEALEREDYRALAVEAMRAVFRRPVAARRIDSATFCHGIAGLLAIALRFVNDTGGALFVDESRELARQLLEHYQPDSLLGFRNIEVADHEIDQPGLLDGAPGVALVLLAATTNLDPTWDRLFLLS
jgi:lantibiotic biosynthesis protein